MAAERAAQSPSDLVAAASAMEPTAASTTPPATPLHPQCMLAMAGVTGSTRTKAIQSAWRMPKARPEALVQAPSASGSGLESRLNSTTWEEWTCLNHWTLSTPM